MQVNVRLVGSLFLYASLAGCGALYNAKDDKAAQGASKSFDDAGLGRALGAERAALEKDQITRQGLVRRSQLALRDASLAQMVDAATAKGSWDVLSKVTTERIGDITGKSSFATPSECTPVPNPPELLNKSPLVVQLGLARRKLETIQANVRSRRSQIAVKFAAIKDAPVLTCAKTLEVPRSLKDDDVTVALIKQFNRQCTEAMEAATCVSKWTTGPTGLLGKLDAKLTAIEESKLQIAADVANRRKVYKDLLAQAEKNEPTPGAATGLAAQLEEALTALESVPFKSTDAAVESNPVLARFAESGRVTALNEKKELLESYIEALKGKESATATLGQHRVTLVSKLVNRISEQPAPPTAGILMEGEFIKQQIAAAQKRIDRATQTEIILKNQLNHLLDELEFLLDTRAQIEGAPSACKAKPLFVGISSGSNDRCSMFAVNSILSFSAAWTAGRTPVEQGDYLIIDQSELAALDESEAALLQSEGVIKAAIAQIVALNASGIKPEDLAALSQALSLPVIAVRVK